MTADPSFDDLICRVRAGDQQAAADPDRQVAAIAADLGGNAVTLRNKLSRALDRVARELGLDDERPK
jgi:antitoxin (DNA-binding transcriptional repressor) of toxin-antitoxin stability system